MDTTNGPSLAPLTTASATTVVVLSSDAAVATNASLRPPDTSAASPKTHASKRLRSSNSAGDVAATTVAQTVTAAASAVEPPVWFQAAVDAALNVTFKAQLVTMNAAIDSALKAQLITINVQAAAMETRSINRIMNSNIFKDSHTLFPLVNNSGQIPLNFPQTTAAMKNLQSAHVDALLIGYGQTPDGTLDERRKQLGAFCGLLSRFI
ncbi:hypothetical protein BCR33DRAFT_765872 [Rhizoclosmatium globosum]|uniref:Uncharacterized protein n=1 Tax=Rhizoclosmatium globosum TaxID=329046 RepID=A0A1Y2CCS7_9FUNG|nr:hypothetical protein BCR33DRAFT_765872 [Rhizoclosmatium globosum]|eukprot:ORY44850.1 hypothetical protein BCR33DRAFT_765872 [Rhizoclosmatium globosum]